MTDSEWAEQVTEPDYERMFRDPALAFDDPMNVVRRRGMKAQDKSLILRRWEHMLRTRSGSAAGDATLLRIRDAMRRLDRSPTTLEPLDV